MPIYYAVPCFMNTAIVKSNSVKEACYPRAEFLRQLTMALNIKLFDNLVAAKNYAKEHTVVVDRLKNNFLTQITQNDNYFAEHPNAIKTFFGKSPKLQEKKKAGLIVVLYVHDNSLVKADDSKTPGCRGQLLQLKLGKDCAGFEPVSLNSDVIVHSIMFNGSVDKVELTDNSTKYKKLCKQEQPVSAQAKKIIHTYYSPTYGLFLSGNWNRHFKKEAKALDALLSADSKPENMLTAILAMRKKLFATDVQNNGSFQRRLNFTIEILVDEIVSTQQVLEASNLMMTV